MKKDGEKITVKFYLDYFSEDDKRELSVVKNGESVKVRIKPNKAQQYTSLLHVLKQEWTLGHVNGWFWDILNSDGDYDDRVSNDFGILQTLPTINNYLL